VNNPTQLEKMMKRLLFAAVVAATTLLPVQAQSFEEGMATPSAEELKTILAGNKFTVDRADGNHWRLEFKSNGYYFINVGSGYADSGEWKTENGKLCTSPRKTPAACNDIRLNNGAVLLKRTNGEIVTYKRNE
jgi:hypothetical protein